MDSNVMVRSYHRDYTASHQHSAVKLCWALSVLGLVTSWEPRVTHCTAFCRLYCPTGAPPALGAAVMPAGGWVRTLCTSFPVHMHGQHTWASFHEGRPSLPLPPPLPLPLPLSPSPSLPSLASRTTCPCAPVLAFANKDSEGATVIRLFQQPSLRGARRRRGPDGQGWKAAREGGQPDPVVCHAMLPEHTQEHRREELRWPHGAPHFPPPPSPNSAPRGPATAWTWPSRRQGTGARRRDGVGAGA